MGAGWWRRGRRKHSRAAWPPTPGDTSGRRCADEKEVASSEKEAGPHPPFPLPPSRYLLTRYLLDQFPRLPHIRLRGRQMPERQPERVLPLEPRAGEEQLPRRVDARKQPLVQCIDIPCPLSPAPCNLPEAHRRVDARKQPLVQCIDIPCPLS